MKFNVGLVIILVTGALFAPTFLSDQVTAQLVPEWVKNTAKWFGEDMITEQEFLDAIKFLIENDIIILDSDDSEVSETTQTKSAFVIIPNGNSLQGNIGFYIPLNLEIKRGTTVIWQNDDVYGHTVQSQDEEGKPIGLFNSNVLKTGGTFAHKFDDPGEYPYYCTLHPWRVGVITVN